MKNKPYTFGNIPDLLKAYPNFVLWKYEDRDGKETKVPYQADGRHARPNDPTTWTNYEIALNALYNGGDFDGIGFCLGEGTPIGIDLDHCYDAGGSLLPWAQEIISEIHSYTEASPSGKGIRIFVNGGSLPPHGRKKGDIEIYESGRYLTVTGNHIPGTPTTINNRSEAILCFHRRVFGHKSVADKALPEIVQHEANLDVEARLQKAFSSQKGQKIKRIYEGDWTAYPSQSEADLALCSYLAFWLDKDSKLIEEAFRSSGLMRPKWDEKHFADGRTYGESVIEIAIKSCKETYIEPNRSEDSGTKNKNERDILSCLESWESIRLMKIEVEWLVDRLIPKGSITVLFGKGGIGKTWLILDVVRCIAGGKPYLGLNTVQTPVVFIDFENPLSVLNTRTQKLGDGEGVLFWRANNERLKAPKLDKKDYELYKQLPQGAVLIFDTLRAAQDRDENKSDEMGLIMGRLKELRDMGFTIILLHHTAKNSDRIAKGSTAIVDLSDHILGLTLVRKRQGSDDVVVDDDDPDEDLVYRFGVREKTRFDPYHVYLTLNPDRGFDLAPDPQEDTLKTMFEVLDAHGRMKKTAFLGECKSKTNLGEKRLRRLFDVGQGRYWNVAKLGTDNAQIVTPVRFGGSAPLYSVAKPQNQNPVLQDDGKTDFHSTDETPVNNGFGGFAKGFCQTSKPEIIDVQEVLL